MKLWQEWSTSVKLGVAIVASWVVPPLISHTDFAEALLGIAYIAFFFGIMYLAGELKNEAQRKGMEEQYRILAMNGKLKEMPEETV
jgi:hypothetical protein